MESTVHDASRYPFVDDQTRSGRGYLLDCLTRCLAFRPLRCLRLFFGFPLEVLACAKERVAERGEDGRLDVDPGVVLPFA